MASDADRILLSHARTRGLLTDAQVEEGIDRQLADAAERGIERPIGEVLVEAKWLTADQLTALLEGDAGEAYRREEARYIEALAADKLVPPEKVDECRRKIAEDRPRRAAQLLLEEGSLTASQHKTLCERLGTLTGRKFGKYLLLERLGTGGMGRVYKAWQPRLDRLVAIKLLPADLAHDPEFVARFQREARALASLNHPNVVAVHDYGEEGGEFHLVMELVDGVSLREVLAGGKMEPKAALRIVPELCDALEYAHGEGVVHRDIKPENILMDKRGRVKIADFGLAKIVRGERAEAPITQSQRAMGTPHYMAPEQFENPRNVDHRADIYSLGVVLYEMLTGELPVGRFEPPSRRAEVSPRLDEVVFKALEKRPERRYQHASEVKEDVTRVGGVKVPVWRRLPHRGWAMFAAGFLVCAAAGAGLYWGFADDGPAAVFTQRQAEIQVELVEARRRYTDGSPQVRQLIEQYNELETELAALERRPPAFLPLPAEAAPPEVEETAIRPFRTSGLQDAAFAADGSRAFLTDLTNRCVTVIAMEPLTIDREVPVDGEPLGIACDPDGGRVFVTTLAGDLIAYDTEDWGIAWRAALGAHDLAWLPDALAVTARDEALVVDPQTGAVAWRAPIESPAAQVEAGPDRESFWVMVPERDRPRAEVREYRRQVGAWEVAQTARFRPPEMAMDLPAHRATRIVVADARLVAVGFGLRGLPDYYVWGPPVGDMSQSTPGALVGATTHAGEPVLIAMMAMDLCVVDGSGAQISTARVGSYSWGWVRPDGAGAFLVAPDGLVWVPLRAIGQPRVQSLVGPGVPLAARLRILLGADALDTQSVLRLGEPARTLLGQGLRGERNTAILERSLAVLTAAGDGRFLRDAMALESWQGWGYVLEVGSLEDPEVRDWLSRRIRTDEGVADLISSTVALLRKAGDGWPLDLLCDTFDARGMTETPPGRPSYFATHLGAFGTLFAELSAVPSRTPWDAWEMAPWDAASTVCAWWRYHRDKVRWDPERGKFVGRVAVNVILPDGGVFADGFIPTCRAGYMRSWSKRQAVLLRVAEGAPPLSFAWEGDALVVTRGDGQPWPSDSLSEAGLDAARRVWDPGEAGLPADVCAVPLRQGTPMTLSPEDPRLARGGPLEVANLELLLPSDTPNPSALRTALFLALVRIEGVGPAFIDEIERIGIGRRPEGWGGPFEEYDFGLVRTWVERIVEVVAPAWPDGLSDDETAQIRQFLATLRP